MSAACSDCFAEPAGSGSCGSVPPRTNGATDEWYPVTASPWSTERPVSASSAVVVEPENAMSLPCTALTGFGATYAPRRIGFSFASVGVKDTTPDSAATNSRW